MSNFYGRLQRDGRFVHRYTALEVDVVGTRERLGVLTD